MVVHIVMLLFMCLLSHSAYSNVISPLLSQEESGLSVSVSQTEKQFGQYFRVSLKYSGKNKLSNINLHAWRQHFKVIEGDGYLIEDEFGQEFQILKLRLYPRMTGSFSLAALKLDSAISKTIDVNVISTIVNRSAIKINWQISSHSPWQREPVFFRVQIQTRDIAAHVLLEKIENDNKIFRKLKTQRRKLNDGKIIFETGWAFYPSDAGSSLIDFPVIRYQLSGSDRRRFYFPLQALKVNALPNYLPPDLPITKLSLRSEVISTEENAWKVFVKSSISIPYGVPGVAKQLAVMSDSDVSNIKKDNEKGYLTYISPLPKWLSPIGRNLNINIRYFNPETGRIETIIHKLPRVLNMPLWAWKVTSALSFILVIILLIKLQPSIKYQLNKIKTRKLLQQAKTPQQLRKIILNNNKVITLNQWAGVNHRKIIVANKLNKSCFSSDRKDDFYVLKRELLQIYPKRYEFRC